METAVVKAAELLDRNEVTDLVYRLGVALDEGRFDDMRSIFTEDASASTPGGSVAGIDALIAQARRNHGPEQRNQHVTTNLLIDLDGDRATIRANLVVNFVRDGAEPFFTLGEVYRFDARRTPDGWRLSRVESTPVWATGSRPR
jgi:3-phenylpropionate/cinnamic acid dioxygenase small subunit